MFIYFHLPEKEGGRGKERKKKGRKKEKVGEKKGEGRSFSCHDSPGWGRLKTRARTSPGLPCG